MTKNRHLTRATALALAALLAASLLSMLAGSKPAQAAFPGANGPIAYEAKDSSGHYQIYTIPPGGGASTQVTTDATNHYSPEFSPDGKTIAYLGSDSSGYDQIFTIPSSGGTPTQVTPATNHKYLYSDDFSPDGKTIVYEAYDGSRDDQIFTIPSSGGTPTQVTHDNPSPDELTPNHSAPVFSPDGKKIAYYASDSSNYQQIYTIPPGGGTPAQITTDAADHYSPDFSPDGKRIVYAGDEQIYTIPASGGTPTQLTNDNKSHGGPAYSPDGTKIAYNTYNYDTSGGQQIYTIPASGGTPTQITNDATGSSSNPDWGVAAQTAPPPPPPCHKHHHHHRCK